MNEGFASWVEYLGLNSTNPEWRDVNNLKFKITPVSQNSLFERSLTFLHAIVVLRRSKTLKNFQTLKDAEKKFLKWSFD